MNYQQTLDYLYSQLPMFQRIGAAAYKADLNNTHAICNLLGNPYRKFRSIHVAGTNGKGSTSHMLASILQSSGLKVGLYTSPHLKDFRERIKINGKLIPHDVVVDFVAKYRLDFEKIQPSFFEMTVGLAFDYFAGEQVDIAVIEVGLGGRLDSTNVITPELSVITNISFDHMSLLGNTIEKIAEEKAGIIKHRVPVVIGESQPGSKNVFIDKAAKMNAEIIFADERFKVSGLKQADGYLVMDVSDQEVFVYKGLKSELLGIYQRKNIPTVLAAVDVLRKKGFDLSETAVREGMSKTVSRTSLLGRWQILSTSPLIVADTGHNEAGIEEVLNQIETTPHKLLHVVLGMVSDKDISKILGMLPHDARYYFCKANIPRALPATELCEQGRRVGLVGEVYESVSEALSAAKVNADAEDLIFVGGSTFTVAEVV